MTLSVGVGVSSVGVALAGVVSSVGVFVVEVVSSPAGVVVAAVVVVPSISGVGRLLFTVVSRITTKTKQIATMVVTLDRVPDNF